MRRTKTIESEQTLCRDTKLDVGLPAQQLRGAVCLLISDTLGEIAAVYVGLPTKQSDIRGTGRSGNILTVRALRAPISIATSLSRSTPRIFGRDMDKYRAAGGDVLIAARSTSLKTAVVPADLDGTLINATLVGVRCQPVLEPLLLLAYLRHPDGQAALAGVAQSATAQMNITVSAAIVVDSRPAHRCPA